MRWTWIRPLGYNRGRAADFCGRRRSCRPVLRNWAWRTPSNNQAFHHLRQQGLMRKRGALLFRGERCLRLASGRRKGNSDRLSTPWGSRNINRPISSSPVLNFIRRRGRPYSPFVRVSVGPFCPVVIGLCCCAAGHRRLCFRPFSSATARSNR